MAVRLTEEAVTINALLQQCSRLATVAEALNRRSVTESRLVFTCRRRISIMRPLPKPLSAGQVRSYHEREFASERQNYWSRNQQGHSEWQGQLANEWGLSGAVGDEHFARLTEGQH